MAERALGIRAAYLLEWARKQDAVASSIAEAAQHLVERGDELAAQAAVQKCHSLRVKALLARAQAKALPHV